MRVKKKKKKGRGYEGKTIMDRGSIVGMVQLNPSRGWDTYTTIYPVRGTWFESYQITRAYSVWHVLHTVYQDNLIT